jgi:hypothetical protein
MASAHDPDIRAAIARGAYPQPRQGPAPRAVVRLAAPAGQMAAERAVSAVLADHGAAGRPQAPAAVRARLRARLRELARSWDALNPIAMRFAAGPWVRAQMAKREKDLRACCVALGMDAATAARMAAEECEAYLREGSPAFDVGHLAHLIGHADDAPGPVLRSRRARHAGRDVDGGAPEVVRGLARRW